MEKAFWAAIQRQDTAAAVRLTGFPTVISGPQGVAAIDQPAFEKMMKSSTKIRSFEMSDFVVKFYSREVAVVAYRAEQEVTVDGEDVGMSCAESSTWMQQDGEWKCIAHSEAIIGDPYGRDRVDAPSVH
ncbi:MAG: nuclear transport factor 2 family protein [Archangiaceae bacterium]|nr:nuclear transport factor 2 family protein [Archangiaceae bacterium]